MTMIEQALTAGVWSAFGSSMGKLSGTPEAENNDWLWCFYVLLMIIANTFSFRHYLHSLDMSANSWAPTVISTASSYLLSGILAIFLFKESMPLQWWIGTSLIINGITLIARQQKNR